MWSMTHSHRPIHINLNQASPLMGEQEISFKKISSVDEIMDIYPTTLHKTNVTLLKRMLSDGESNPGLPRDRRGYLPLYYLRDITI